MIGRLPLAGLALALVGADAPVPVAPGTFVAWEASAAGHAVSAGGLVAVNTSAPCPIGATGVSAAAGCVVPAVRLSAPGAATAVELRGEPGDADGRGGIARLAIGTLAPGRTGAILTSFSGGAHCCESYAVALPQGSGWRRLAVWRIEVTDQGPVRQTAFDYGLKRFPTDLDHDGRPDFVMGDDAFAYAFTDYADSWSPPVILNAVGDGFADVSRRPAFARLFEEDMARARRTCVAPGDRSSNGACAAYAADAARLGRLRQAWPVIRAHYDRSSDRDGYPRCTAAPVAGRCPPGRELRYRDYPAALRAFLVRTGYLAR